MCTVCPRHGVIHALSLQASPARPTKAIAATPLRTLPVNLFCYVLRGIRRGVTKPDATNDEYTARSAANQSTSGEPNGRPLPSQSLYASFATNSCRSSPRRSVVNSIGCCLSGDLSLLSIGLVPRILTERDSSQTAFVIRSLVRSS